MMHDPSVRFADTSPASLGRNDGPAYLNGMLMFTLGLDG